MSGGNVMNKVRVLLVARWPVGGIRSYLRYSYGLLASENIELVLVGPASADLDECEKTLSQFRPRVYRAKSTSLIHVAKATNEALGREHIDLVHAQGYSSALAVALLARVRGIPQIVTIHDMFTDALRRKPSVKLGRLALASALGLVDVIQPTGVAVEANYRKHMDVWPATRARIVTLRNGVDVHRFAGNARRDLRAELSLRQDDFLIGFLGRFMAIKGFHCLIAAIEQMVGKLQPARRPVVVAVGSGGFIREDKTFIEQKQLGDHFKFLPHTNDVAATLRGMDVVAIPSFSEASPILPMEALVCGVPVIASNCAGLADVLKDTPAKLFPIGDSTALANTLMEYMDHSNLERAIAFSDEARARFDATKTALQIRDLIYELTRVAASSSRPTQ